MTGKTVGQFRQRASVSPVKMAGNFNKVHQGAQPCKMPMVRGGPRWSPDIIIIRSAPGRPIIKMPMAMESPRWSSSLSWRRSAAGRLIRDRTRKLCSINQPCHVTKVLNETTASDRVSRCCLGLEVILEEDPEQSDSDQFGRTLEHEAVSCHTWHKPLEFGINPMN